MPVREAVLSGISHDVAVRESAASGAELLDEAIRRGALAIVTTRSDAEEVLGQVPDSLLVIGISARTPDVLVARDGESRRLANPKLEVLDDLIRRAAGYADGTSDD
jgi:hypothetical protein